MGLGAEEGLSLDCRNDPLQHSQQPFLHRPYCQKGVAQP